MPPGDERCLRDDAVQRICAALPQFGTTGIAATIAALPPDALRDAVQAIARTAPRVSGARILGIHIEGPFLNPQRAGAQQAAWMRAPSRSELESLQASSGGLIRLLTLAPELPGSLELIGIARALGIAVALGHSQATEEEMLSAIDAGASHVTHLFNASAGLHHREPGLVGTALTDDRLSVELIADGARLDVQVRNLAGRGGPGSLAPHLQDARLPPLELHDALHPRAAADRAEEGIRHLGRVQVAGRRIHEQA
jgi:N-acetylglucosamine-6-phosphate deacetylase